MIKRLTLRSAEWVYFLSCFCCLLFLSAAASAQVRMDTAGLKMIDIRGDSLKGYKSDQDNYQRVIGSVVISHDGTTMTCDSAHFRVSQNIVEAFSNVNISRANGTQAKSDYIKYTGHSTTAFMKGNVQILDGNNTLYTEQLTYNLRTKIGKFSQGGTLQTEETTVSSNEGTYNGYTKQSYFVHDVIITNPKYTIESQELTYNTTTKVIRFLSQSTIMGENSTVHTLGGTYDSKNEKAVFHKRTTIETEEQVITGNKLEYNDKTGFGKASGDVIVVDVKNDSRLTAKTAEYNKISGYGKAIGDVVVEQDGGKTILYADISEYNKKSGYAKASGNVELIDTAERSRLICGQAEYNEHSKFMLASLSPKLITVADEDSTFMRADTILTLRLRDQKELDRIPAPQQDKKKKSATTYNLLFADSTYRSEDKSEPKLIIANHRVKVFSDSMQAVCDSLVYHQGDSTFSLYRSPVMWSKSQQSSADTIYIHTVQNKLSEVNLRSTAFLISETGYAPLYDQVSGNYIDAFFVSNQIDMVKVNQNAESIYYAKDDAGAFIGMNKAESSRMNVYFKEKKLDHLVMHENPKGVFYPIDKLSQSDQFLTLFKLQPERKPKSKEEILED